MSLPLYGYEVFSIAQAQGILILAMAKGQMGRVAAARAVIQQFQEGGAA